MAAAAGVAVVLGATASTDGASTDGTSTDGDRTAASSAATGGLNSTTDCSPAASNCSVGESCGARTRSAAPTTTIAVRPKANTATGSRAATRPCRTGCSTSRYEATVSNAVAAIRSPNSVTPVSPVRSSSSSRNTGQWNR